ncbi:MAG TPA: hypothetical protein VFQ39_00815, partial [Longimicrobium sp.]|nr:hypothetical protein [Longimicrobium sp.]
METETDRFEDGATFLWQLGDEVLVRCPRCERMARVARTEERGARLTCAHCGLARAAERRDLRWAGPVCAYL